jgi:hypothetical protein
MQNRTRTLLAVGGAAIAAGVPAAGASAASSEAPRVIDRHTPAMPLGAPDRKVVRHREQERRAASDRTVRLARTKAKLLGREELGRKRTRRLRRLPLALMADRRRELRHDVRAIRRQARIEAQQAAAAAAAAAAATPSTSSAPSTTSTGSTGSSTGTATSGGASTASAPLESIAACESGGDPTAVSPDGQYRGKYQFDQSTWESVGGSGDPAAASEAEQDMRAQELYSRAGASPWPVCGR